MPIIDAPESMLDEKMKHRISERFSITDGLLVNRHDRQVHMLLSRNDFINWFTKAEEYADQPLGRRLAHAAADHEACRLQNPPQPIPRGLFSRGKRMKWLIDEWQVRGIGTCRQIDEERVQIQNQIQTAMAGGQVAGAWEVLNKGRFRFRWEMVDASRTDVILDPDSRENPVPRFTEPPWSRHLSDETVELELEIEKDDSGWAFRGHRSFLLGIDLLNRFAEQVSPHLERNFDDGLFEFQGRDTKDVWQVFARAQRDCFLSADEHILVDTPERWLEIVEHRLERVGFGRAEAVDTIDGHGGVEIVFESICHPAMLLGTLVGFWQRCHGRDARGDWRMEGDRHLIRVRGRHQIADSS